MIMSATCCSRRRSSTAWCCSSLSWGGAHWVRPAAPRPLPVVDGDTLEWTPPDCLLSMGGIACLGQRLRLYGVDAFESTQTCRDARAPVAMRRRRHRAAAPTRDQAEFACHVDPEFVDRHAREFAVCTAGGRDVGAMLVSEGLAFAYGRGSQYLSVETEAKAKARGAWAGRVRAPAILPPGRHRIAQRAIGPGRARRAIVTRIAATPSAASASAVRGRASASSAITINCASTTSTSRATAP